jgi:hypothetical protein
LGKAAGEDGWEEEPSRMRNGGKVSSSVSGISVHYRLADWLKPTAARNVDWLIDKASQRETLQLAWKQASANLAAVVSTRQRADS